MKNTRPIFALYAAFAFLLVSCNTLRNNPAVFKLIVEQGVLRAIDGKPDRAVKAISIADDLAQAAEAGESVAVNAIKTAVLSKIDLNKYSLADQDLIRGTIDIIAAEFAARVGDGIVKPEDKMLLSDVAMWIEQAARRQLAQTPLG